MDVTTAIRAFLDGERFAVAGASTDRSKYGNKCLRCYVQNGREVVALHPRETEIEGRPAFASIDLVPGGVHGLSIVTPPPVTERIVAQAAAAGLRHLWMQPGAESAESVRLARELGLSVISGGPCLLVVLGFREG